MTKMKKYEHDYAAGTVQLIGALIYVFLSVKWVFGSSLVNAPLFTGGAAIWVPLLGTLALVCSIMLAIVTLVSFMTDGLTSVANAAMNYSRIGGFALIALTAGNVYFIWALVGFILTYSITGSKSEMC